MLELASIKSELASMKTEFAGLKFEFANMKLDITVMLGYLEQLVKVLVVQKLSLLDLHVS